MNQDNQIPDLNNDVSAVDNADTVPDAVSSAPTSADSAAAANGVLSQPDAPTEILTAEQPQNFIPTPEGYVPVPPQKKRSLLWLWITLPVLAVALIVVIVLLCLNPGASDFKNAPQAYLATAIGNTGSAVSESFQDSPFAAMASGCEGIKDVRVKLDFLMDLSEMDGSSVGISLDETVNATQKALMAKVTMSDDGQAVELSAYSDETDMMFQVGGSGWKGFTLSSLAQDIKGSVFAPGSGSFFEMSNYDVDQLIEMTAMMQAVWESVDKPQTTEPSSDGSPFLDTLLAAFPQPEIGKSEYTFGEQSKSYDSYLYHFTGGDLTNLSAAFWKAVDADPVWSTFFNNAFSAEDLSDWRNEPVNVDPDEFFDLTIAFNKNHIVAATLANDGGHMELLLGENPARAEDMSFTYFAADEKAFSLSRHIQYPESGEGFSDVFTLSFPDYDEEQAISLGADWNKKSGDLSFSVGVTSDNTPIQILFNGTMQAGAKGQGFSCDIEELAVKVFTMQQAIPLTFAFGVEPGQPIEKPDSWQNLFSMTEDEVSDWLNSFMEDSGFSNYV